jgi:K+-transporting ATPase ATPase A chain
MVTFGDAGTLGLLVVLLGATVPFLGRHLATVLDRRPSRVDRMLDPVDGAVYRLIGVDPDREQRWTVYARSLLAFSAVSVLLVYALQRLQGVVGGPGKGGAVAPLIAFNTAISFVTNTNWQSYAGESTMRHVTQAVGLGVQNFASAAVGIAVATALIRGLTRSRGTTLGSFWVDLVRVCTRVLLPFCLVVAVAYVGSGVVMNVHGDRTFTAVDGHTVVVPGGPVASQEAVKQIGQNGGGFYNANSAHPFENPTPWTNLVQLWSILAIPFSLAWAFGILAGDRRQGAVLLGVMALLWLIASVAAMAVERSGNDRVVAAGVDETASASNPGGNLEGKELRLGAGTCGLYAAATTGTSNGAVVCAHDSLSAAAGGVALTGMLLGEVTPGGSGSGLYGMLVLALLSVFIAGLMVGRTPEYLGKKIQAAEMKLAVAYILAVPLAVLCFTGIAVVTAGPLAGRLNDGPHGLSEIFYAYASAANNNGSAFGGLTVTSTWYQLTLGVAMLVGRFLLIVPVLAIAGSLVRKPRVAATAGTFPTGSGLFAGLLTGVVLIVAGLTYFPALALGPIVEHLS